MFSTIIMFEKFKYGGRSTCKMPHVPNVLKARLCSNITFTSLSLLSLTLIISIFIGMDKFSRTTTLLFLLFCILFVLQFQRATLDEGGQNFAQDDHPEKPLLSKIVMDTVSLLRKSHKSSWDKIKTVIHDLQMQFSPPNLDFRGGGKPESVKEKMKEAVGKSFDKSKESVEETAKSAAGFVGGAIHKTTTTDDSEKKSKSEL